MQSNNIINFFIFLFACICEMNFEELKVLWSWIGRLTV